MSKAGAWYEAAANVRRIFEVAEGVKAAVFLIEESGPHLDVSLDAVRLAPTAEQAVAFAHWLLDTFGEDRP